MKRSVVLAVAMAVIFITAHSTVAGPIDRYIGQMRGWGATTGLKGNYRGKPFILYAGDRLVMEMDRRDGKIWIVGIYYPDVENEENVQECVVALKKIEIHRLDVVLNVNINEEWIHHCY